MRFWLLLALLLITTPAISKTVAELERAGHLQISSSLLPGGNIVPGQKIELAIDIATNRWFAGGTRIRLPEVAGLVILQTNSFASNSTEQRQGQTWVVQRWTLDVFPQRSGEFSIPSVSAAVEVNDESAGVVTGTLHSPAIQFHVKLPETLAEVEHWVAAPTFAVTQRFDRALDTLQPGDAILREVVFEATEVMAMMLPHLETQKGEGLVAYPQAPVLTNNSNRGTTTAQRVDKITYIAEQEGRYILPAQTYYWWDTQANKLRTQSLPEVEFLVENPLGENAPTQAADKEPPPESTNLIPLMIGAVLLILCALTLWLGYRVVKSPRTTHLIAAVKKSWRALLALTQPALPKALNPDNSAGE